MRITASILTVATAATVTSILLYSQCLKGRRDQLEYNVTRIVDYDNLSRTADVLFYSINERWLVSGVMPKNLSDIQDSLDRLQWFNLPEGTIATWEFTQPDKQWRKKAGQSQIIFHLVTSDGKKQSFDYYYENGLPGQSWQPLTRLKSNSKGYEYIPTDLNLANFIAFNANHQHDKIGKWPVSIGELDEDLFHESFTRTEALEKFEMSVDSRVPRIVVKLKDADKSYVYLPRERPFVVPYIK